MLKDDERMDHIAGTTYQIIQSDNVFTYSIDAILLARFASIPLQKGQILDLCSGNGVVGMTMTERTRAAITLMELQEPLHTMALRSIEENNLCEHVTALCADLKEIKQHFAHGFFDTVTCNPPYFKQSSHEQIKENRTKAVARHELACTLSEVVESAAYVLKHSGKLAIVHRPDRLVDIIEAMKKNKVEPKRIQFCHSKASSHANMLLIEGIKGGKPGLKTEPPLMVYEEDGRYTKEFNEVYFRL
ncbi:tRNA1(Val) (adenine(37)-N6)-methyltransferase [Shouchella lehensis]|uniref:Methyltransferase, small n=1 Tax=Shouchella lehensis G1 TaxID=1246626 RepID=A0A060M3K5_9BACI|nr:tRNA1(Val) (adenine(37)-N6)-methyltransferase [Shouchella lehensis]AIC96580.1 Methyltransferase, small [Shouchella lehensis G1]